MTFNRENSENKTVANISQYTVLQSVLLYRISIMHILQQTTTNKCISHKNQDFNSSLFLIMLLVQLYVMVGILLPCWKFLHARIISLRADTWSLKASFNPVLVVCCKDESVWLCKCVHAHFFFLHLFLWFSFLILELLWQKGTFSFSFYLHVYYTACINERIVSKIYSATTTYHFVLTCFRTITSVIKKGDLPT